MPGWSSDVPMVLMSVPARVLGDPFTNGSVQSAKLDRPKLLFT